MMGSILTEILSRSLLCADYKVDKNGKFLPSVRLMFTGSNCLVLNEL